nr:MAG TPA: tail tape measure [Caudoviricetes sp.]
MSKTVGVILSLRDKFTSPLNKVNEKLGTTKKKLKEASRSVSKFTNAIKSGMKSVAKWTAIGFGALTAGATLFIKQSIDGAKQKLKADKLLETNLMKQANASKEHIKMLKDEASALQDIGVVGDDVAVAGASRLAVFKMNAEQIKKTMPILDDMIAYDKGLNGTQEDAIAIGELYGKAINGKVNALKKYGVVLTANEEKLFKVMSTEQRIEFINKKLEKSIGGTNKALRATDEGKIVAMKGAWGDMQAELGKKLMPKLGAIAEWFHSKIPAIQDYILSLADKVEAMVIKAEPYITQVKELLGKIFEKIKPALDETWKILGEVADFAIGIAKDIKDNWDWIAPIVTSVAVAFGVYKTAIMLASAKTLLFNGIMVVTNFLLTANPIGLVVVAIGALIGVIVSLCKNWDKVKVALKALWEIFKEVMLGCWEVIKGVFLPIWQLVVDIFIYAKNIIVGLCNVVGGIFTAVWDGVISALDKLKAGFNKVTDFITGVFQSAWDSLMKALDMVLHPIETAKKAFGGLIDKLKFWNNTKIEDKTVNINEVKTTDTIGGGNKSGTTTSAVKNPRHALGTAYFKGGVTGINEGGRNETAILPAGTQILSHEQGKAISNKTTKGITININVDGNIIGEREHMEKYGDYISNKILSTLGNM